MNCRVLAAEGCDRTTVEPIDNLAGIRPLGDALWARSKVGERILRRRPDRTVRCSGAGRPATEPVMIQVCWFPTCTP